MKKILLYLWQLPQNICGLFVILFNIKSIKKNVSTDGIVYYTAKHINNCGVSLGNYIFLDTDRAISNRAIKHEYGHQIQSLKLGWLYLPTVGLVSSFRNLWDRAFHKKWSNKDRVKWYYSHFPEKQADKYGKVNRF